MVPYPLAVSPVKCYRLVKIKHGKAINEPLEFLIEFIMVALLEFCRLKLLNAGRMPRKFRENNLEYFIRLLQGIKILTVQ